MTTKKHMLKSFGRANVSTTVEVAQAYCGVHNKVYNWISVSAWEEVSCGHCLKHHAKIRAKHRRDKRYLKRLKGSGFIG